jgi:hypothetical protein
MLSARPDDGNADDPYNGATPLMIGTTLGHFRILEALGAGGMGEVFIAHDTKLDRKVALKVLHASVAGDPDRRERFAREARAIAALNHPNIVTVYSVEDAGDTYFLTMELIEGRTLADLIPARVCARSAAQDRDSARRRRQRRAHEGHHAPGPEAGQRDGDDRRTREGAGFRPGQVAG